MRLASVRWPKWGAVRSQSRASSTTGAWRPSKALDDWVRREARPISLRQLTFFGRTLTEKRLLESANYVRSELPTRLAHRIRDMQTLPYVVVTNQHMSHVFSLYYDAFEVFRKVPEITSVQENEEYCKLISRTLREHLTVIPRLATGILECQDLMDAAEINRFMNTLLKSRISRRVIAEQHLSLTESFNSPWHFAAAPEPNADFVGEVFLHCNAKEVIEACWEKTVSLVRETYGPQLLLPELKLEGHLTATFPYILSHLQYIVGEILRNSIQAVAETSSGKTVPSPVEVLICEAPQHVIIRISDQGGGIPADVLPSLWSFSKRYNSEKHLQNLSRVPRMAATMQEVKISAAAQDHDHSQSKSGKKTPEPSSLGSLAARPPNLRLGIGLPMSRVYAEYWAGSLELHNLDGYGVDAFLQISRLGNKNEQLSTRASMDSV